MGQEDVDKLLTPLWKEVETLIPGFLDIADSPEEDYGIMIEQLVFDVEQSIYQSVTQLGENQTSKNALIDTTINEVIHLSTQVVVYLEHAQNSCDRSIPESLLDALHHLIFNLRSKFLYLQDMPLYPPQSYIDYILDMEAGKIGFILKTFSKTTLHENIVTVLKDYLKDPIPIGYKGQTSVDGFQPLDYFVDFVDAMYKVCRRTPLGEVRKAVYYELISRNFNAPEFIRVLEKTYNRSLEEIDDPVVEIQRLHKIHRGVSKIPVISGMAYIPSNPRLKTYILRTINAEIRFIRKMTNPPYNGGPFFSLNRNVRQFILLFNAFLQLAFMNRITKKGIPTLIYSNFTRATTERFSLKSLKKKNSLREVDDAEGLIEMLYKTIAYIKRYYL